MLRRPVPAAATGLAAMCKRGLTALVVLVVAAVEAASLAATLVGRLIRGPARLVDLSVAQRPRVVVTATGGVGSPTPGRKLVSPHLHLPAVNAAGCS